MIEIENVTGFPHVWFEKIGPRGAHYDVLVIRGCYDIAHSGKPLKRCGQQPPIEYSDVFDGPVEENPLKAVLLREGSLLFFKPTTDIHVVGTAMTEDRRPKRTWLATIAVGQMRKTISLCGPRQFNRVYSDWHLTSPEPTVSVPIDYRYAFGGCFSTEPAIGDTPVEYVYKQDNPAGCGWVPDDSALRQLSKTAREQVEQQVAELKMLQAPQIEDPKAPVTRPDQSLLTQGLAPMARWCVPRLSYAGTYDDAWRTQRYPYLPDDFDCRFYQSAHPDMICSQYLAGNERVSLVGLMPEGESNFELPGLHLLSAVRTDSGRRRTGPMSLDTVEIDLNVRRVGLTWRAAFERNDPVRRIAIGVLEPEMLAMEMGP